MRRSLTILTTALLALVLAVPAKADHRYDPRPSVTVTGLSIRNGAATVSYVAVGMLPKTESTMQVRGTVTVNAYCIDDRGSIKRVSQRQDRIALRSGHADSRGTWKSSISVSALKPLCAPGSREVSGSTTYTWKPLQLSLWMPTSSSRATASVSVGI